VARGREQNPLITGYDICLSIAPPTAADTRQMSNRHVDDDFGRGRRHLMPEIVGRHQRQQVPGRVDDCGERIRLKPALGTLQRQDGNRKPQPPGFPAECLMRNATRVDVNLQISLDDV